jgi:hypothetical protein
VHWFKKTFSFLFLNIQNDSIVFSCAGWCRVIAVRCSIPGAVDGVAPSATKRGSVFLKWIGIKEMLVLSVG